MYLPCVHSQEGYYICGPNNSKGLPKEWDYNIDQWDEEKKIVESFFLIL